jgi:hypothetical protein
MDPAEAHLCPKLGQNKPKEYEKTPAIRGLEEEPVSLRCQYYGQP